MRIVAGEYGGRVIKAPADEGTRPTTDRVRESMFSSITSRLDEWEGVRVLDAFAGSGALGIEALSRGASQCVFYEQAAPARKVIQGNLKSLGIGNDAAQVKGVDFVKACQRGISLGAPFSLVLLDPPYAMEPEQVFSLVEAMIAHGDLSKDALVVYEHAAHHIPRVEALVEKSSGLASSGQKKYGKIAVSYLVRSEA